MTLKRQHPGLIWNGTQEHFYFIYIYKARQQWSQVKYNCEEHCS